MTFNERIVGLLVLGRRVAQSLQPIAPLLTRLVLGITFIGTGLGKWQHLDKTAEFFKGLGIPAPGANAAFVATVELVGGAALIVGLGTRLFAALLSCTMIVALLTADRDSLLSSLDPSSSIGLTDVAPLVLLLFLAWLIAFGAGPWSVDRLFPPTLRGVA